MGSQVTDYCIKNNSKCEPESNAMYECVCVNWPFDMAGNEGYVQKLN